MGFDRSTVQDWCADPTFPGGASGPWQLSLVLDWWRSKRSPFKGDDPEMGGEGSPALERYREARANMVEMDLAVRRGELVPREQNRELLNRLAQILRQAGDTLQKQFGPEPHSVLDEALGDVEREIESFFGDISSTGIA